MLLQVLRSELRETMLPLWIFELWYNCKGNVLRYVAIAIFVLFHKFWSGIYHRQRHPIYMNWVYFEQITVKTPTVSKIGCFFCEIGILMGGKWEKYRYSDSQNFEVQQAHPRPQFLKLPQHYICIIMLGMYPTYFVSFIKLSLFFSSRA